MFPIRRTVCTLCFLTPGLLVFAPLATAQTTTLPAPIADQEIALQGTILSLNAAQKTLVIEATAWFKPDQAAKTLRKIAPSKRKSIVLAPKARLIDWDTDDPIAFKSLGEGDEVTVTGLEMGAGKPFQARLVAWKGGPGKGDEDMGDLPDTPRPKLAPGIAAILPAPQSVSEATISITDLGFKAPKDVMFAPNAKDPALYFRYQLDGKGVKGLARWLFRTGNEGVFDFKGLEGPNGQKVPVAHQETMDQAGIIAPGPLDPQWKTITAVFELLDPKAPDDAAGAFATPLVLDKLPIPAPGATVPITREFTTPRGTKVTLESIVATPAKDKGQPETRFNFRIEKPASIPDLKVDVNLWEMRADGLKIPYHTGGSGSIEATGWHAEMHSLAPAGAKELLAKFSINESAPSLKKRDWVHTLRFEIPVAAALALLGEKKAAP